MVQMRPLPPISDFNKALGTITKMGHYTTALSLILNKLQQFQGILVDIYTFNIAINCCCRLNRVEGGYQNVRTFNVFMDALTKEGKAKEAERELEVMIQRGVDPNVVTYSTLMDGYCLQGHMDEAIRVFNTMVDRGLHPVVVSYNILINGYSKKMKIDEAMHLFREMPRRGLKHNSGTFNTMLQGLFRSSTCGAAQELFMRCKL
ncbi:hypothetical protein HYC85_019435 [Camellia sinensis]|uniref:Pentacotripeptide-repeat region of PRORP domain-containing protein n=1 Tax=Camellia sinensis TaxID=4442 RepID=A0A7J7GLT4_CAMSI|nr:hypothetical protein HYC85_019435 [Camellia sinensis]